jgi:hypothetical protein
VGGSSRYMQRAIHFTPYLIRAEIKLFAPIHSDKLSGGTAGSRCTDTSLEMGGTRSTQRMEQNHVRSFS